MTISTLIERLGPIFQRMVESCHFSSPLSWPLVPALLAHLFAAADAASERPATAAQIEPDSPTVSKVGQG